MMEGMDGLKIRLEDKVYENRNLKYEIKKLKEQYKLKVMCKTGLVDGLTQGNEYEVRAIKVKEDGVFYMVVNDYGIYMQVSVTKFVNKDFVLSGLSITIRP